MIDNAALNQTTETSARPTELTVLAGGLEVSQTSVVEVVAWSSIYSALNWLYDFPLYGAVIWYFGLLKGGLVMAALSIPTDLLTYLAYRNHGRDVLGLEYVRDLKTYRGDRTTKQAVAWALNRAPTAMQALLLSMRFNSFLVTTFLRKGDAYTFSPWTRRDWCIFWLSYVTAQAYWISVIWLGLEVGERVVS